MATQGFPATFTWGASTSCYQIEGAAGEDGRGESIWDRFARTPGRVRNGDTGDVACDHYHRYRDDAALMAELNLDAYRFSIAWPRVLPTGTGPVNEAGLDFYDRLVDAILERGVAPHATLYHWDLPQVLEDAGGWPVRATADAFVRYADVVARRLGDRLATLATLNEPWCSSHLGYELGIHAPGRTDRAAALAAAHHLLLAHGMAMGAIRAAAPRLQAGIVLNFEPHLPASEHPLDVEAAAFAHARYNRWFLDPLTGGDYPEDAGRALGWRRAEVLPGDMTTIAAPLDFMGVNYYTRTLERSPLLPPLAPRPDRRTTGMGWEIYPDGLTGILEYVASRTGDLPLYIDENGAAFPLDPADPTRDPDRVAFLRAHFAAALTALERGVPLRGYFVWSFMDNFEWAEGYAQRFGLVHVDYATQERRIRDSGRYVAAVARSGDIGATAE
ncbi:MAG TPA: GH1 family beta-glucosidase [Patescibacteria group bacterium]|nr:GH1 family beta-glucosidase [Patescibacteria group bacterium]